MNWRAAIDRVHLGALQFRERARQIRPHITLRRVIIASVVLGLSGASVITVEALVRARLGPIEARVPSTWYTRPVAWGSDSDRRSSSVAIARVSGAPLESRDPVPLDEIPPHLIDAVLSVEDQRFFDHSGLDLRRIAGAMLANIKAGGIAQGGSTITQQLAKNLFLSADRTPIRKLREAAMALVLESRYEKQEILEAYLNEIYLGQDRGAAIHGMGAAARYYFGKDVRRLVLSEAATLAAMIRSPNRLAPDRHPERMTARRNLVLGLMAEQGRVSESSAQQSSRVRLPRTRHPAATIDARYFGDYMRENAPRRIPDRGVALYTTLDATLQRAAVRAVQEGLGRLGQKEAQAALVVLDPRTGDVLAMVGGRDYGASQFNRAVNARRQPGSAFKPLVALAALEPRGRGGPAFTLASTINDSPLNVTTPEGPWQPANYDGSFRGPVTLRRALEQSLNVPFARIGLEVGAQQIVSTARRLGIETRLVPVPSLALGSGEVSVLELARAYGVFATGGQLARTRNLLEIERRGSAAEPVGGVHVDRVADEAATWLVTSALQGVVTRGTGRGIAGRARGMAGKTGTSNDSRDAWFMLYNPDIVIGAWVGHDDGKSLSSTGGEAALPIVSAFLARANLDRSRFDIPEGVVEAYLGNGDFFSPCGDSEFFLAGTAPDTRGCEDFEIDFDIDDLSDLVDGEWGELIREHAGEWLRDQLQASGILN